MKTIDFSLTGGMPHTQQDLEWMQDGYKLAIEALAGVGEPDPYIITGMELTGGDGDTEISEGWMYYRGGVYYCPGGYVGADVDRTGVELQELPDADRERTYFIGEVKKPRSHIQAIPVDTGEASYVDVGDGKITWSDLKRGRLPYDVVTPTYEYYTGTESADTLLDGCLVNTEVMARLEISSGLILIGIKVQVVDGDLVGGAGTPDWRSYDSGHTLPWFSDFCSGYQEAKAPVWLPISSNVKTAIPADPTGVIEDVRISYVGNKLWVSIQKMASGGPSVYYASCSFFATKLSYWAPTG